MYSKVLLAQCMLTGKVKDFKTSTTPGTMASNCLTNFFLGNIDIFFTLNFTEFDIFNSQSFSTNKSLSCFCEVSITIQCNFLCWTLGNLLSNQTVYLQDQSHEQPNDVVLRRFEWLQKTGGFSLGEGCHFSPSCFSLGVTT